MRASSRDRQECLSHRLFETQARALQQLRTGRARKGPTMREKQIVSPRRAVETIRATRATFIRVANCTNQAIAHADVRCTGTSCSACAAYSNGERSDTALSV